MLTNVSKVFAVVVTALSLAFMGFAAVTLVGGPNYQVEHVDRLGDYVFELSPGEKPTWAVKTRRGLEAVRAPATTLPGVVLGARQHLDGVQNDRKKVLEDRKLLLASQIKDARLAIEQDLAALERRGIELKQELDNLHAQIKQVSDNVIMKTQEAQGIREEAARRREDVFRLTNQLEEIRTDYFRVTEQIRKHRHVLVGLRGSIDRADRRNRQLRDSTPVAEQASADVEQPVQANSQ